MARLLVIALVGLLALSALIAAAQQAARAWTPRDEAVAPAAGEN